MLWCFTCVWNQFTVIDIIWKATLPHRDLLYQIEQLHCHNVSLLCISESRTWTFIQRTKLTCTHVKHTQPRTPTSTWKNRGLKACWDHIHNTYTCPPSDSVSLSWQLEFKRPRWSLFEIDEMWGFVIHTLSRSRSRMPSDTLSITANHFIICAF